MKCALALTALLLTSSTAFAQQSPSWYYCDSSQAFFPYIRTCKEGWRAVDVQQYQRMQQAKRAAAEQAQDAAQAAMVAKAEAQQQAAELKTAQEHGYSTVEEYQAALRTQQQAAQAALRAQQQAAEEARVSAEELAVAKRYGYDNLADYNQATACDSDAMIKNVIDTFKDSPQGRLGMVQLLDIATIRDITTPGQDRHCVAIGLFNSGKIPVAYHLEVHRGKVWVEMHELPFD